MSEPDVLVLVLRPPEALHPADLRSFLDATRRVRGELSLPIERAIAGGVLADRIGYAFASGYQAALTALVPSLDPLRVASFCVTEPNGNHPRAIETRLEHDGAIVVLTGEKRWSTMAPVADVLVVVARRGTDAQGRPELAAVRVPRETPGLDVRAMPPPPFVPEVLHAELTLSGVRLPEDHVLPGDGFVSYSKAFRTVEDLHVNMAVLAYGAAVAARKGFSESIRERAAALLLSGCALAQKDPKLPETHLALAGLLQQGASLLTELDQEWERADDAERALWQRDRVLVQVAGKAREQRRIRAWDTLLGRTTKAEP